LRDSGICAVLLMDAQIDHVTGLLMLRERSSPLPLYATPEVFADLSRGLPLVPVLSHFCGVARNPIRPDGTEFFIVPLTRTAFTAVPLSSKAPPYSPHRNDPHPGDNIGLSIASQSGGARAFYAPGLGGVDAAVLAAMAEADVVLVDGTFWSEEEMLAQGLSAKPAAAMGHLPQSGLGGMIELLDQLPELSGGGKRRKILIHINNSNPILREDSAERAVLTAHGIEVACDGMEIDL
jgi:pyrroloquinoline quinone biosynthesis protein B